MSKPTAAAKSSTPNADRIDAARASDPPGLWDAIQAALRDPNAFQPTAAERARWHG